MSTECLFMDAYRSFRHRECGVSPTDRKDLLKVRSLRNSSERILTHHIGKHLEYDHNLKSPMKKTKIL